MGQRWGAHRCHDRLVTRRAHAGVDAYLAHPHGVINQGHGNATGRAIQIYEHDEINREAIIGILTEIVANNRRGGWRRLGRG